MDFTSTSSKRNGKLWNNWPVLTQHIFGRPLWSFPQNPGQTAILPVVAALSVPYQVSDLGSSSFICPKIQVHTHVCFELVALPVGRFWIWPCRDLVFNRTLLTHKPNWKFIVLLNMMLVRHLGHFIFHKMTWHAAFVANSHFVLIHKGRIMMIVAFQAVNSNKRTCALIDFKRHWQRNPFWNFAHLLS